MPFDTDQSPVAKLLRYPVDGLALFRKFWKTKQAITAGMPLYDWTPSQREKKGFLGPWMLNIQETLFATLPAIGLVKVLNYLYGKPQIQDAVFNQLERRAQVFLETLTSTNEFFYAAAFPSLFTLLVFLIGWGSLKRKDSNRETRRRAREAYLYFDGAHGIFSQGAAALGVSILLWVYGRPDMQDSPPFAVLVPSLVLVAFGMLTQLYITASRIPRLMAHANRYSTQLSHFWQKKSPDEPPLGRYHIALLIGGWPCFLVVYGVWTVLSLVTALCLTVFKMLVAG